MNKNSVKSIVFLGCYRATAAISGVIVLQNYSYMSAALCIQLCKTASSNPYSIVRGGECICSNNISSFTKSPSNNCTWVCPGNPKQICGSYTENIYSLYNSGIKRMHSSKLLKIQFNRSIKRIFWLFIFIICSFFSTIYCNIFHFFHFRKRKPNSVVLTSLWIWYSL